MIPTQLWIVLFFVAGVIFAFMLFFADRAERAVVQGMLIGSVVAVISALMLLLNGLDDPFHGGVGGLKPVAMERSLADDRRSARRDRRPDAAPVQRGGQAGGLVSAAGSHRDRVEVIATVLLAVATVATAWSGYQSTRWNGEQAKAGGRANALRIESAKAAGLANTQTSIDVATFTQWTDAYALHQTELADFYFRRFRAEFRPAVDAWVATKPLKNPSAPLTPVRDAAVQAEGARGRGTARRGSRRLHGQGADEHPAGIELRARRRPVRVGAVLRGHEHEAEDAQAPRRDALPRLRHLLAAPPSWMATSPISLSV